VGIGNRKSNPSKILIGGYRKWHEYVLRQIYSAFPLSADQT